MKKIALDFDGTIADTNAMKSALIKEYFDYDIPPWQCNRTLCVPQIGEEKYTTISDVVYTREATLETPPLENAIKHIPNIAKIAEVSLVTARPLPRLEYAKEWLEKHRIDHCFTNILSSHVQEKIWRSKLEICQENDFELLIDDDIRHLNEPGFANITKLLIRDGCQTWLEQTDGIFIITGWNKFYQFMDNCS